MIHQSDHGSHYLSIRYWQRLTHTVVHLSTGSVGESQYSALAETIVGLYAAEVIHRPGPSRTLEAFDCETLAWVDGFNSRRLLESVGSVPPAEQEKQYLQQ